MIFVSAIEASTPMNALPCQFVIANVCRAWRVVALSTPEYWAKFYVSPKMPMSVYRTYLSRSSPFPLSVEFYSWPPCKRKQYSTSSIPILEGMLAMLEPETQRLRSLTIQGGNCSWTVGGIVRDWIKQHFIYPP
ncbi:hypothetical protein ID866_5134 [Astraeus odoratus]|nr:hypothetical protein ID866_5134 [Astraeus odoratus]